MPTVPADEMIRLYQRKKSTKPSTKKLLYDGVVLLLISLDLLVLLFDAVVMSTLFAKAVSWLGIDFLIGWVGHYRLFYHPKLATIGGMFTLFLVVELLIRWAIAVYKKTYYRWFFFPFVHWYEVLGCFPLLRPLRLLRAIVIVRRLHQRGVRVIPNHWLTTGKFYLDLLLEALSDRVIITAIANIRKQIGDQSTTHVVNAVLEQNRHHIEQALYRLLMQELSPKLTHILTSHTNEQLADSVGQAVAKALSDTPELRRYLRLIPIAGGVIEGQIVDIGQKIGQNVTLSINQTLLSEHTLQPLMAQIAKGVGQMDINDPAVGQVVQKLIFAGLDAVEHQVRYEQSKHLTTIQQGGTL